MFLSFPKYQISESVNRLSTSDIIIQCNDKYPAKEN